MATKRSKEMAAWLRWLRLHGACPEGVAFVRLYSSPQKAWEGLAAAGKCGYMHFLIDRGIATSPDDSPHEHTCGCQLDRCAGVWASSIHKRCAASILKRFPKVPDWRQDAQR